MLMKGCLNKFYNGTIGDVGIVDRCRTSRFIILSREVIKDMIEKGI